MNFHYEEPSKYEQVTIICKMCGEPAFFVSIPIGNLENKLCVDCLRIKRRDTRNRRKAKLSLLQA